MAGSANPTIWADQGFAEGGQTGWLETTEKAIVMQYTGLKDKNGKEIYEGDVDLSTDGNGDKWRGIVTWNTESADYELLNKTHGFQRAFGIIGDEHEIIGNIYENSELLT
jgi:uncharacterized phage protein (TIGR01671 family)